MPKASNTEEFIEKAKKIHGNKYDYSKVEYIGNKSKIKIICPEHGMFLQRPNEHLSKCGCRKCSNKTKTLTTEEFIKRATKIHNNKYDYSKVEYIYNNIKVKIICPIHGEFSQTPSGHLRKKGCSKCADEERRLSAEEFIEKAKKVHGNKYDYSKVEYIGNKSKIKIICPEHGIFSQAPQHHLEGADCKKCANNNCRLSTEQFVERANKIHNNKYDYLKVDYKNSHTKIIIICPIHGEFLQTPNNHLQKYGCRKCGVNNLTTEEFIERAKKVHGNKYDYSKVKYIHSLTDVIIICSIHGEFLQTPNNHFGGAGCQKCAGSCRLSTEEFIKRATKIHNNKYDYSNTNFINVNEKVAIICKKHGEFTQTPHSHLKGHGCKQCANSALEKTKEEFIERANKIHGDKYDYSKIEYVNVSKKVIIICPIHGEFLQTPHSHLKGHGCRKCCKSISKKSQKWLDSLNIPVECREKTIKLPNGKNYRVDAFYNNVVYEFNGDFWHGNPDIFDQNEINPMVKKSYGELYNQTIKKEKEIITAGYKIVSIWENDFNEIC